MPNSNTTSKKSGSFDLQLSHPTGPLSAFVQGIWSISVNTRQKAPLDKLLYSDAGSGIAFNLTHEITLSGHVLPRGVIMLPVEQQAETISLPPGAHLAGIRFLPAVGYGLLGQHYRDPTLLSPRILTHSATETISHRTSLATHNTIMRPALTESLHTLFDTLCYQTNNANRVQHLLHWAEHHLDFTDVIPTPLEQALDTIAQDMTLQQIGGDKSSLSQRQVERLFKRYLGMTPKYYQRILRIKKALCFLRTHRQAALADVAQEFGFSDQAHMTREFRTIACITPKQLREGKV